MKHSEYMLSERCGRSSQPVDLVHLARQTHGDRGLEREVLRIFIQQAEKIASEIRNGPGNSQADLAHTLRGSAQGIGAWHIVEKTRSVEDLARKGEANSAEVEALLDEIVCAKAFIAEILGDRVH